MDWNSLAEDRDRCPALVDTFMNEPLGSVQLREFLNYSRPIGLLKKDLAVWRHVVTGGYYRSASFILFMFDALLPEYHFLYSSSMGGFSSHLMILNPYPANVENRVSS
jgi:hypothetical protein